MILDSSLPQSLNGISNGGFGVESPGNFLVKNRLVPWIIFIMSRFNYKGERGKGLEFLKFYFQSPEDKREREAENLIII